MSVCPEKKKKKKENHMMKLIHKNLLFAKMLHSVAENLYGNEKAAPW